MKKIYEKDNVDNTLLQLQNRYRVAQNRTYSIEHIICAFNMLPGKYQDLLLKPKKDENDKVSLVMVYKLFQRNLMKIKTVPENIKIDIKNIGSEDEKKNTGITMEDIETGGDKWIRKEKKPRVLESSSTFDINAIYKKKVEPVEEKVEEIDLYEEFEEIEENEDDNLSREIKENILKKYIENRSLVDIERILKDLGISDVNYFIITEKFKHNSVRSSKELEKSINISASYIDSVVDEFYEAALNEKRKRIYKLVERK